MSEVGHDRVTNSDPPGDQDSREVEKDADERETNFPVFCSTEAPDQYIEELVKHAEGPIGTFRILSKDLLEDVPSTSDTQRSEGQATLHENPADRFYDFYKDYLQPADDRIAHEDFIRYTFLVIDEECIKADPWQCILCCDAPDYGEADEEIKLKQLRLPLQEAAKHLCVLEQLVMTPSEVLNPDRLPLCMSPPATLMVTEHDRNEYRLATPMESRLTKKRAIEMVESSEGEAQRVYDAESDRVYFRCSRVEAQRVAALFRSMELQMRKDGGKGVVTIHDNRSEKAKEEGEKEKSRQQVDPDPHRALKPS